MAENKVFIEEHNSLSKRFEMTTPHLIFKVNYDNANHEEVDAAVATLKSIIERYWDENLFKSEFRKAIMKAWVKNENNLQNDFESLDEYLENYGVEMIPEKPAEKKCHLCNDTGYITYGGSFGGPVHKTLCSCKNGGFLFDTF